jgi:copper homeostasis protein
LVQKQRTLLEICIASVDDALAAEAGGADRLELNAGLALGGLTPSVGALVETKRATALPVVVMLRPRPGGFAYSDHDFQVMRRDLDLLLAHGADGVAFGILNEDGTVDESRSQKLLDQMCQVPAVFHRAFDVTPDPFVALQQLIGLGFCRLLTSGQQPSAHSGCALLAELVHQSRGRIEILPGGGVNRSTVTDIVAKTGCNQVHASLRVPHIDPSTHWRPMISFGSAKEAAGDYDRTSVELVAELAALLR